MSNGSNKTKDVQIRVDAKFLNTLQHALSTASHHFHSCPMFDGAAVRPADRLAQIREYERVFTRIIEIEVRNGWRKAERARKEPK